MAVLPSGPVGDVCNIAEYITELADRGEADDTNYANSKAIPHKKLIYKITAHGKQGKLFIWLQKRFLRDSE